MYARGLALYRATLKSLKNNEIVHFCSLNFTKMQVFAGTSVNHPRQDWIKWNLIYECILRVTRFMSLDETMTVFAIITIITYFIYEYNHEVPKNKTFYECRVSNVFPVLINFILSCFTFPKSCVKTSPLVSLFFSLRKQILVLDDLSAGWA